MQRIGPIKCCVVALLFCVSMPSHSTPYKSVFGFEYALPNGWEVLAPNQKGIYDNEVLQSLGSENIYQNNGYGELLKQIKSGDVEYIFEKQSENVHFKNNIRIQIDRKPHANSVDVKKRCAEIEQGLNKILVERIVFRECQQKSLGEIKYIVFSYYRPVIAVTTVQAEIPISTSSNMVLSGSSNRKGLALLKQTQEKLLKAIAGYYASLKHEALSSNEQTQSALQTQQHDKAITGLNKLADFGNAQAEYSLGLMHEKGQGMPVDLEKAFQHYSSAAKKQFPAAVVRLAQAYSSGFMVKQDVAKAIELYRQAAELGVASAQNQYASFLYQGIDTPKNQKEAKKWFIKALEQGDEQAARNLIAIYRLETRWGSLNAHHALAQLYLNGLGVEKNPARAIELMQQAAEKGYVPSRETLAKIYTEGLYGQPKNPGLAQKWQPQN